MKQSVLRVEWLLLSQVKGEAVGWMLIGAPVAVHQAEKPLHLCLLGRRESDGGEQIRWSVGSSVHWLMSSQYSGSIASVRGADPG